MALLKHKNGLLNIKCKLFSLMVFYWLYFFRSLQLIWKSLIAGRLTQCSFWLLVSRIQTIDKCAFMPISCNKNVQPNTICFVKNL